MYRSCWTHSNADAYCNPSWWLSSAYYSMMFFRLDKFHRTLRGISLFFLKSLIYRNFISAGGSIQKKEQQHLSNMQAANNAAGADGAISLPPIMRGTPGVTLPVRKFYIWFLTFEIVWYSIVWYFAASFHLYNFLERNIPSNHLWIPSHSLSLYSLSSLYFSFIHLFICSFITISTRCSLPLTLLQRQWDKARILSQLECPRSRDRARAMVRANQATEIDPWLEWQTEQSGVEGEGQGVTSQPQAPKGSENRLMNTLQLKITAQPLP